MGQESSLTLISFNVQFYYEAVLLFSVEGPSQRRGLMVFVLVPERRQWIKLLGPEDSLATQSLPNSQSCLLTCVAGGGLSFLELD